MGREDGEKGMAWFNSLSEQERAEWLKKADSATPADAWEAFKKADPQTVRQDGISWSAGFEDGMQGRPANASRVADRLAYESGYIEGKGEAPKRRGRPPKPDAPSPAERKRQQRADKSKATAENIRRATLDEFELALLRYCNDKSEAPPDAWELLNRVADRFEGAERRKVFRYYIPEADPEDMDGEGGGMVFRFPNRRGRP